MSPIWNFSKALRETEGRGAYDVFYDKYLQQLDATEGFYTFQHWMQINHRDVYKKALAYARVVGWV